MCREQLTRSLPRETELISVSRSEPIHFGDINVVVQGERSVLTMHRQILAGLVHSTASMVFLCENDVLYHPSHFSFDPIPDTFCYNTNVWRVRYPDGLAVWTDDLQQMSGLCAYREVLIDYFVQKLAQLEAHGDNRHYEPGLKQSVGCQDVENHLSMYANLCIRHDKNLTKSKWSPDEFRNPKYARGWRESDFVLGWGYTSDLFAKETAQ